MKALVVYHSKFGQTERLARAMAEGELAHAQMWAAAVRAAARRSAPPVIAAP